MTTRSIERTDSSIKAIETRYKGYRFRSRLEARWAVYFDTLGWKWEYEKEGYDLSAVKTYTRGFDLRLYLPDFWLPEFKTWVEIKPGLPKDHFFRTEEEALVMNVVDMTDSNWGVVMFGLPQNGTPFTLCIPQGGEFGSPDRYVVETRVVMGVGWSKLFGSYHDNQKAVNAALSARFEHGESGAR